MLGEAGGIKQSIHKRQNRAIRRGIVNRAANHETIAAYLGISDSTYLRKSILENLVSAGCLIEMTISRSKAYKTNPESVRIL